jgi:hypothetical protein
MRGTAGQSGPTHQLRKGSLGSQIVAAHWWDR